MSTNFSSFGVNLFQNPKLGLDTLLIYKISRFFFDYFKDFSYICDEIVFNYDFSDYLFSK